MTDALKPCPFCGEDGEPDMEQGLYKMRHMICCITCHAEGPTTYDPEHAVQRWNERAVGVECAQDSEAQVLAIAGHIDGWRSATFGWQGDADPIKDADNRQCAIHAHDAECLRRIRATLGVGCAPVARPLSDFPDLKEALRRDTEAGTVSVTGGATPSESVRFDGVDQWSEDAPIVRRFDGSDGYRTSADGLTHTKVAPDAATPMVSSESVTLHVGADGKLAPSA